MVLAASEDKTFRGGFVAAPGRPWAWANALQDLAVYHAVWSRDLYQIATGLLAMGDRPAANRALDYLWNVQQRPDGSFPQNSRLDGTPVFGGLQMDEVSFPIVLAHQLGRTGRGGLGRTSSRRRTSSSRTARARPGALGERRRLLPGHDRGRDRRPGVRRRHRPEQRRRTHARDATCRRPTRGSATLSRWTGDHQRAATASSPYFLRITATGDANAGTKIQVSDGGPLIDQRAVVDPSFLELVRLGVQARRRPGHPQLAGRRRPDSWATRTPNGPFWHRASFDGYGERRDGIASGSRPTTGSGLDARTRLAAARPASAASTSWRPASTGAGAISTPWPLRGRRDSHFIAEQVWDHRPPAGRPGLPRRASRPSRAAPLAWTHAQFLRLACSIDAGYPSRPRRSSPAATRRSSAAAERLGGLQPSRSQLPECEIVRITPFRVLSFGVLSRLTP